MVTDAAWSEMEIGLSHGEIVAALLHTLLNQAGGSITVKATDFWVAATTVKRGPRGSLQIAHEPRGQITFQLRSNAPPA